MVLQGGQDAFCEGGDGLVDEIAVGAEVALEADAEVFSLGVIAGKCANDGMTVIAGESGDEAVAPVDGEDNGSNVLVGLEGDTAFTVAQVKTKITHNSPHWDRNKRINTRKNYGRDANSIARRGQGGGLRPFSSAPCGVWGNAPTVPRATDSKGKANKGAGSEASLPVTLRFLRSAPPSCSTHHLPIGATTLLVL